MLNPLYKHSGALSIAAVLYLTTTTPHALPGTERHLIAQDVISRSAIGARYCPFPSSIIREMHKPYLVSVAAHQCGRQAIHGKLHTLRRQCLLCSVGSCARRCAVRLCRRTFLYNSARIACTRTCQSPHTRSSMILPSGVIRKTSSCSSLRNRPWGS